MPSQFAALGACVRAQLAFVRLLAGMRSQMDDQIGPICENFTTILAGVPFLSGLRGSARRGRATIFRIIIIIIVSVSVFAGARRRDQRF